MTAHRRGAGSQGQCKRSSQRRIRHPPGCDPINLAFPVVSLPALPQKVDTSTSHSHRAWARWSVAGRNSRNRF